MNFVAYSLLTVCETMFLRKSIELREVMNQNETASKVLAVDHSIKCSHYAFSGFRNEEKAQNNGEGVSPDYTFTLHIPFR
jgi:hypothetical protein